VALQICGGDAETAPGSLHQGASISFVLTKVSVLHLVPRRSFGTWHCSQLIAILRGKLLEPLDAVANRRSAGITPGGASFHYGSTGLWLAETFTGLLFLRRTLSFAPIAGTTEDTHSHSTIAPGAVKNQLRQIRKLYSAARSESPIRAGLALGRPMRAPISFRR